MKYDSAYRLFISIVNSFLFGSILYYKLIDRVYINTIYFLLFLSLAIIIHFIIFFQIIKDKRNKFYIYSKEESSESKRNYDVDDIIFAINKTNLPEEIKRELKVKIGESIKILGKDGAIKVLINQYNVCTEYEKFYERIAWQVGSIFIPVSFTLGAISFANNTLNQSFAVISGFIIFLTWTLLFGRFRTSIRLYRDCAKLIESILGLFSLTYVYDYCFEQYGKVIRVWPYLITICSFYFNFMLFIVL